MRIAMLGTGMVGRALAAELARRGDEVALGTRDPSQPRGDELTELLDEHDAISLRSFADAVVGAELVVLAIGGDHALDVVAAVGPDALADKVLIDLSNPLDFTNGFPPTLSVCNTTSLGEQVQAAAPHARVVKALNTVNVAVMIDPAGVGAGEHDLFICGNDEGAKRLVERFLTERFGWQSFLDLGDISMARGTEMYMPLWLRLRVMLGTSNFNVRVVR